MYLHLTDLLVAGGFFRFVYGYTVSYRQFQSKHLGGKRVCVLEGIRGGVLVGVLEGVSDGILEGVIESVTGC